jgi:DNA end-binding protein Ku
MGEMICSSCGEMIARGSDQIIKGYEGYVGEPQADGSFPGVDTEYIDSLERQRDGILEITSVVLAEKVDPRYFQKSYDVMPEKGGEPAYALIAALLAKTNRYAIGSLIMSGKEFMVALRPRDGLLAMEALYWPDEIKSDADAKAVAGGIKVSTKELDMGEQLIRFMSGEFEPEKLVNQWAADMGDYLAQYMNGQTPVVAPMVARPAAPKGDLEDMLAASLAAMNEAATAKVATKTGKKAKAA